jgi:hypothetical protein
MTLAAMVCVGVYIASHPVPAPPPLHGVNGFTLYQSIIDRMRTGVPYEKAAVAALRAQDGPLRPFVAVRPPALAMVLSWLPDHASRELVLRALAAATIVAWMFRLAPYAPGPYRLGATGLTIFSGMGAPFISPGSMELFHEVWAGLLIALSLALRSDRRFVVAAVVGCLAALVRELALPYLVVMAVAALADRRRAEAAAFALALAVACGALAWHAYEVMSLTTLRDAASPGWVAIAGWRFVLLAAQWNLIVFALGAWAAAFLVPLALAGACARRDGLGIRLAALVIGYCLGFMVIGRLSNAYWGLVTMPIMSVALCFGAGAVGDLSRRALRPAA